MTVESTVDREALSLTFNAVFDADIARVWQVWEDPRQLELWWGPPTWPASFPDHELTVGHESRYYMTGPEGDKAHGWMRFDAVDEPTNIRFVDGFGDADGVPDHSMPENESIVTLTESDGQTRMTIAASFDSIEALEKVLAMGMQQGMSLALGQIDDILAGTLIR